MVIGLLQLLIVGVWAATIITHTRRLFRLACVTQLRRWEDDVRLRSGASRIWWWLGQDTFWAGVRPDTLKAVEISLMVFLIAWGHA
ncbi:MAG: hypothetical protein HC822_13510 [Oscillochloris sp.]|nr:hypothetical protein [Oscillochloris sp.]